MPCFFFKSVRFSHLTKFVVLRSRTTAHFKFREGFRKFGRIKITLRSYVTETMTDFSQSTKKIALCVRALTWKKPKQQEKWSISLTLTTTWQLKNKFSDYTTPFLLIVHALTAAVRPDNFDFESFRTKFVNIFSDNIDFENLLLPWSQQQYFY